MLLKEIIKPLTEAVKPPKDMFELGSSQQIVGWIRDQHEDAEKAIQVLNFWIMKQGDKIPPNRVKALDFAKELLHKEFSDEGKLDGKLEDK